jgi:hypothetical protein
LSSGCEKASWTPDCNVGSKLVNGLLVVVRAVSQDTLHVPAPHGNRCRTPVDENQSLTSTPLSPSNTFEGGVTLLDRPSEVENNGANAPRLSPTRAASTSVPSRTIASSGLCSTARCTASASVNCSLSAFSTCAEAVVAASATMIAPATVL